MTINGDTKISRIIRENKGSIDVLAKVAGPLGKLRNPVLRKALAGRTTLKQAAKIGGCDIRELAEALKPLGFVFAPDGNPEKAASDAPPDFVRNLEKYPKEVLDVRQDLAEGKDPLKKIMAATQKLPAGHVLELINTFEPTPLITMLEKKGYESYVQKAGPDEIRTWFRLKASVKGEEPNDEAPETVTEEVFASRLNEFGEKAEHVNVSDLEMPMPMVTILEALENLPGEHVLVVQHRRIPVFLFNELRERNFNYLLYQGGEKDVRLLIYR